MCEKEYAISAEVSAIDIKNIRKKLKLTQSEFGQLVSVDAKSVSRWENAKEPIKGPIASLIKILDENQEFLTSLEIPKRILPMRLRYMYRNEICAVIDVDEREKKVEVYNYTKNFLKRPFGKMEKPNYEQYEAFLETRCFPRERDKMKLVLRELDLPFYDPILIIEKTKGKMAEDDFWIKIER